MNAKTRLSAKGQVVIPKDVRDHLGFVAGQELDIIEIDGGVLLKLPDKRERISLEEANRRIREIVGDWNGPPIPVEKLSWHPIDNDDDY